MYKSLKTIIFLVSVSLLQNSCSVEDSRSTEVLVIGGTTSGISAAIQSARSGAGTIVVEETTWLGGMLTAAGVSATDGNHFLNSGIWNEFRNRLRAHYGGAEALATGWVSNTQFEPHTGDSIFKAMAGETEKLDVIYGYHPEKILMDGKKVTGAIFRNEKGEKLVIQADIVIDATDLGDVLFLAGAEYDLGMEAGSLTGEPNGPDVSNNIVQDLTWVAILKDFGAGNDKTIEKPEGYNPELYRGSCSMTVDSILIDCEKMLSYGKLPGNKYMINWPRHGNDIYLNVVEMNRDERLKELQKAKVRTLGFIYYIQTELGFSNLGLADDEFPTADKLALVPYHREGRRLKGKVRFTINNISDIYSGNPLYRTGISVGDYPVDHHHNCNPEAPVIHFPPVPSFNIPAGALIPNNIDGLIVSDKAISVSNLINGSTRLQPVVLLTGQAAGAIAANCVKNKKEPGEINIREVQQTLLDAGAYLMPLFDVNSTDIDFQSIQRVTATGILQVRGEAYKWANRTWFYPDTTVTINEFTRGLHQYDKNTEESTSTELLSMDRLAELLSEISERDLRPEFNRIVKERNYNTDGRALVNKRQIAVLTDMLLNPFGSRAIDFNGNYK